MPHHVIDTNVAVTATGKHDTVSPECRLKCVRFIRRVLTEGIIYIDDAGEISGQYRNNLRNCNRDSLGFQFLEMFTAKLNVERIKQVRIDRSSHGIYLEVPSEISDSGFDLDDTMFIAVAVAVERDYGEIPTVHTATDTGWLPFMKEFQDHSIDVDFICGPDKSTWFDDER